MNKRKIAIISLLTIALLLLSSTNIVQAKANPKGKSNKGEHKGWSEGKRVGQTKKKGRGGLGEHKGWTEGKRVGQKSATPPGWEKGLKKGWKGSRPPGWSKWSKKTQGKWEKDLSKAKELINAKAKKKGWKVKEQEKAGIAIEYAAKKGVPIDKVTKVIEKGIEFNLKGEETLGVGVALSKGVGKGVKFDTLGSQVVEKLKEGYRGKELTDEIDAMVKERYKAKMKAQEEKTGKPVGRKEAKPKEEKTKREKPEKEKGKPKGKRPWWRLW